MLTNGEIKPGKSGTGWRREAWRGTPGYFRLGRTTAGVWRWVTPGGEPWELHGVNDVARGPADEVYARLVGASLGDQDEPTFGDDVWRRLTAWGFNALGPGAGEEVAEAGRPRVVELGLRLPELGGVRLAGIVLPDVFEARWVDGVEARVAVRVARWREDRDVVGYFTDGVLGWPGEARGGRPGLLQVCLSLEPSCAAYHAAWEFVLAPLGGELGAWGAAWGVEVPGRGYLRQWTQEDRVLDTAGYRRDEERFQREFARRYFAVTTAAVRRHDPYHLVFGPRWAAGTAGAVLAEAAGAVDAMWLPGVATARAWAAGEAVAGDGPVVLDGFAWNREWFRTAGDPAWSELERMLANGRAVLTAALGQARCVGYTWAAWRAGDPWTVPPWPAGLVYDDERAVWAHVEPLAAINAGRARGAE